MNKWIYRSAALVAIVFVLLCAADTYGQPDNIFAGTWRGVGGDAGVKAPMLQFTIEDRNGQLYFVGATALDPDATVEAAEMTKYLRGPLTPDGTNRLRARYVLDQVDVGDAKFDGVVVFSFRLSEHSTRLHIDIALYVDGIEPEHFTAVGDFKRIGPVPSGEPAAPGGEFSEFVVQRPTFYDAFKVFAEDDNGTTSTRPLLSGVMYRIRVEGSVNLAPAILGRWVVADGAYIYYAERGSSYFGRTPARANVLLINDLPFEPAQPFNTAHIYTMDIEGDGRPLTAIVADPSRDDNAGSLDIRVYRLRPDILEAYRPTSIDRSWQDVDRLLGAQQYEQAADILRQRVQRAAEIETRERIYQLIGVLDFVTSRPLDPEQLKKNVVMEETNLIGRAVRYNRKWPSAQNNMAVWSAWNGNISINEDNALSLLEKAQKLAPGNRTIRTNLTNIRAEAAENPASLRR